MKKQNYNKHINPHYEKRAANRPIQTWKNADGTPVGKEHVKGAIPVKEKV